MFDQISEDPSKISNFVEDFYKKLYSEHNSCQSSYFLSCIKSVAQSIDETQKDICDQDISLEELKKNISKLKDNKSPMMA